MVSAVVFDLDDTLYLEADFVRSGFGAVGEWCSRELKLDGFEPAAWRLFREGRRGDIFDAALLSLGTPIDKETISRMVEVYRTHAPQISLPADSVDCLRQLRGKYKLGLITDGPAAMQWNKIRALRLEKLMDELIVTSDLGKAMSKPHEQAFRLMEERLLGNGRAMIYVADNPAKDFVAPARRGWRTIRVVRQAGLYRQAAVAAAAEFSVEDLGGVPAVIEGW